MSSIIYNGHEIQDLIINGNQAQLWLNGQKLYPEDVPIDTEYYFDFGNTYTLNSGTPGSVDLSNTNLNNATKQYVCIAMKTTITVASSAGNEISVHGLTPPSELWPTPQEVFSKIAIQYYAPSEVNLMTYSTNMDSVGALLGDSSQYPNFLWICMAFYLDSGYMKADLGTRTSNTSNWFTDYSIFDSSRFTPNNITTISSPGTGDGSIVATKFVGRGFDVLQDAKDWFDSLT